MRSSAGRDSLSRAILASFYRDFAVHGESLIAALRTKDPATYLKLCLQIMPKQDGGAEHPLAEITDDELAYLERLLGERRSGRDQGKG